MPKRTLKAIKPPKGPKGPPGICWVRDRHTKGNRVGAHCQFKKNHKGKHSWQAKSSITSDDRERLTNAVSEGLKCLELVALGVTMDGHLDACRYCGGLWTAHADYCSVPQVLQQMRDALAGQPKE
jgi:hypothetical protein